MTDQESYRCYCCKQVFTEYAAREHFGSWLNKDLPKCVEVINGTATWGGGIHDPFLRVRKDHYGELQARLAEAEAQLAAIRDAEQVTVHAVLEPHSGTGTAEGGQ